MAPVVSGGVEPSPSTAAAIPGWLRPMIELPDAAVCGAAEPAGCEAAHAASAAALARASCTGSRSGTTILRARGRAAPDGMIRWAVKVLAESELLAAAVAGAVATATTICTAARQTVTTAYTQPCLPGRIVEPELPLTVFPPLSVRRRASACMIGRRAAIRRRWALSA